MGGMGKWPKLVTTRPLAHSNSSLPSILARFSNDCISNRNPKWNITQLTEHTAPAYCFYPRKCKRAIDREVAARIDISRTNAVPVSPLRYIRINGQDTNHFQISLKLPPPYENRYPPLLKFH